MKLSELIYAIEGEVEDAPIRDSQQDVLIVTADGQRFVPVAAASDGELLIINVAVNPW